MEGPFINPQKKGAHDAATMKTFDKARKDSNEVDGMMLMVCCE